MLLQKLKQDQIAALKSHDQVGLTTLRYIVAQAKNKEIDAGHELSDEEVLAVLKKFANDLKESSSAFKKGNRADLVAECDAQLAVVSAYLPPEISDEELKEAVGKLIAENQALFDQNPKALMGISIKALKDKASTNRILSTLAAYNSK